MDFRTIVPAGLGIIVISAGMLFGGSHGQGGPHDAAIKARKAQMQLYAFNIGKLGAMAKGEAEYNADAAQAAADNIATMTGINGMAMWPQGSDNGAQQGTRALPAMWANFPDVGTKAQALKDAAAAMQAAAGTDLGALQGAMSALGGACGACHKAYRQPE